MQKTCWIMQKFKQFITLIIVPFHCFAVMWTAKWESFFFFFVSLRTNLSILQTADDSLRSLTSTNAVFSQQLLLLKCQCFSSNRNQCKNKTSTQAHRQKMRGTPGGLKSLANEAASFRQCLGEKLLLIKIVNLFCFYVCENEKQMPCSHRNLCTEVHNN